MTPTPAQDATPTAAPTETSEIKIANGFKVTYNEETDGDLLPVAFIAMAVVATVALVVVSRKRKEF